MIIIYNFPYYRLNELRNCIHKGSWPFWIESHSVRRRQMPGAFLVSDQWNRAVVSQTFPKHTLLLQGCHTLPFHPNLKEKILKKIFFYVYTSLEKKHSNYSPFCWLSNVINFKKERKISKLKDSFRYRKQWFKIFKLNGNYLPIYARIVIWARRVASIIIIESK